LAALLREKGGEIRRESVRAIELASNGKPIVVCVFRSIVITDSGGR
jgi:hypothetical protein